MTDENFPPETPQTPDRFTGEAGVPAAPSSDAPLEEWAEYLKKMGIPEEAVEKAVEETLTENAETKTSVLSALKARLPIIAVVAALAVAAILVCVFFMPKRSPAEAVLRYVDDRLPDNAVDVAKETVGIPSGETLLTVEGVNVSAEEYLYWLGNITSYYDIVSSYSGSAMDLTREAQPGITWDEQLKLAARDNSILLALVPSLAREFGVELTAEDLQGVVDSRAANIEAAGGAAMYAYQLQAMGISDATALKLDATSALYNKIQEAWLDRLAQDLTDQDVADYAEENDILRAKHILLMTIDPDTRQPLDAVAVAQKRTRADELLAQLRADPSGFDSLMNEYSEDSGLANNPDGYLFTAGQMVSEFEAGTRALEYDQISEVIESEYGYHIILRLDPDSDELRRNIAYEGFNDAVQARVDQAHVVEREAYASFTTADYYERLLAFQGTLTQPEAETADGQGEAQVVDQSRAELEPAAN